MAYIRKRGKTWSFTVSAGKDPVTGDRRQETKTGFRTKKEAELAAAEIEMAVASGTYVKEQNISFRAYSEKWMKWYTAGIISKKPKISSIRQREYQIATLLKHFDAIKISDITGGQYQDALVEMISTMARNTLQGVHGTARMIFQKAKQEGIIKVDPTEYARVPAEEEKEELPKYMEKEQLAKFLQLAKLRGLDNDYQTFLVLAYTGMRIGELCVLRWKDIDFEAHTISINGTLYNPEDISNRYEVLPPKTKTSKRMIDVDPLVIAELEALRARQNEFKMRNRKTYHDADFVFGRIDTPAHAPQGNHFGYPPKIRTIQLRMDRITQWMSLPTRLTPHSLRHTHTSLCAEAGIDIEVIMKRLGHKNDTMTRMVYLHVTKSMNKEASKKFGDLMSKVVKL